MFVSSYVASYNMHVQVHILLWVMHGYSKQKGRIKAEYKYMYILATEYSQPYIRATHPDVKPQSNTSKAL